jgi:hypothetical protein
MMANLLNPHLHQMVVILDSINENTIDCQGFLEDMTIKLNEIHARSSLLSNSSKTDLRTTLAKLNCVEHRGEAKLGGGQPTYFEMFHYATYHPSVKSDIVIMSNADQVFDETLEYVKNMSHDTIFVLSNHGYEWQHVPGTIREQYRDLVGGDDTKSTTNQPGGRTYSRCADSLFPKDNQRKVDYSDSWDTYVFHRSYLKDTLPRDMIDDGNFTRLTFQRESSSYYMNEFAAEYAALFDITRDLLGKVTVWHACRLIQTWHCHLRDKMHHGGGTPRWPGRSSLHGAGRLYFHDYGPDMPPNTPYTHVTSPYAYAPMCSDVQMCYSDNKQGGIFFHGEAQMDANKDTHT